MSPSEHHRRPWLLNLDDVVLAAGDTVDEAEELVHDDVSSEVGHIPDYYQATSST